MRFIIAIAVVLAALGFNSIAKAEEAHGKDAVRIEADQGAKAFIFIIDDEPVAMLDENGLRIVGSIEYGGTLTDSGAEHIRQRLTSHGGEAADE